ncbi:hypothetical protein GJ744_001746 [Endocarpon pusillum]|uniref:Uncharacterized protein n=1 Tax=Endocarpon pusillum TaxID=364733 RepID=A0A8H7E0W8_9EURO|nr:hypothetical protein GJ744_001746 [Endocarpon pusillum]
MSSQGGANGNGESYGNGSNALAQPKAYPPQDAQSPYAKAVRRPALAQTTGQVNSFTGGLKPPQVILNVQQTTKEPASCVSRPKSDILATKTPSIGQQTTPNPESSRWGPNQPKNIQNSPTLQNDSCKQHHNPAPAICKSRERILRQKQNIGNSHASQHGTSVQKLVFRSQQASERNALKREIVKAPQTSKAGPIRQKAGESPPASSSSQSQQRQNAHLGEDPKRPTLDRDIRQSRSKDPQNQSLDANKQDESHKRSESTVQVRFLTTLDCQFKIPDQFYPLRALIPNLAALYNERRENDHYPRMEARDLPPFFHPFNQSGPELSNDKWTIYNAQGGMPYSDPDSFWPTLLSPLLPIAGNRLEEAVQVAWTEFERYFDLCPHCYKSCIAVHYEPSYSLPEAQRIAQAALYFEEAIYTKMNDPEDDDPPPKRNWLHNPHFSSFLPPNNSNATRVMDLVGSARSLEELIDLMNPIPVPGEPNFSWMFEFGELLSSHTKAITFEGWPNFRSPVDAMNGINWIVSFITASMNCPGLRQLTSFPRTEQGLSAFLSEGRSWARH